MSLAATRRELLVRFRAMYQAKHFELDLFDLDDGYLQTTLSDEDRMPLRFFVEYNNAWWFAIISGVSVPAIAYDEESSSGSIVLDISYGDDILRAMQHVRFGDGTINRLRTYASPVCFTRPNPLVALDAHGNADVARHRLRPRRIETGAEVFLTTPKGRHFTNHQTTKDAVARIKANLAALA